MCVCVCVLFVQLLHFIVVVVVAVIIIKNIKHSIIDFPCVCVCIGTIIHEKSTCKIDEI